MDGDDNSSTTTQTSTTRSVTTSIGRSSGLFHFMLFSVAHMKNNICIAGEYEVSNVSLASETSLSPNEKESLFLKLENCMNKLSKRMNFNYMDMSIAQRAFVSCCHFVCDEILKQKYR